MRLLILSLIGLALLTLVVAAVTGRVRMQSCCSTADPRMDLRMRDAIREADAADAQRAAGQERPL